MDLIAVRVSVEGCLVFDALQMPSPVHPNDSEEHAESGSDWLEEHTLLNEFLI